MKKLKYYLEEEAQSWNGIRHMHSEGCAALSNKNNTVQFIGAFSQPIQAMSTARKIHRRTQSCSSCCKIAPVIIA